MYIQYMSVCQSRCNVYSNNTEVSSDLSNFVGSLCWCISSKAFWSRSTSLRPIQNVFLHSSCFLLMLQRSTIVDQCSVKFRNIDSHTPTINELYITQPERDRASPVLSNEYFQLVVQNQRISALTMLYPLPSLSGRSRLLVMWQMSVLKNHHVILGTVPYTADAHTQC